MKKTTLLMGRLTLLACLLLSALSFAQTQTFTTSGSFTVPAGVTSIQVEAWGGGGAGGAATGNPSAGGGGSGGAYAKNTAVAVVPGTVYTVTVGTGGIGALTAGANGGSSWFGSTTTLLAVGGNGGARSTTNSNTAAGATAPVTGNVGGTVNFYGGNGGTGVAAGVSAGGGGGSAGTASNGNAAITVTGGIAVTGGSAGANGSAGSGDGASATGVGAGGAGARAATTTDRNGGSGADGKVIITYACPTYSLTATSIGSSICAGGTATVNLTGSATSLPKGTYTVTYNLSAPNAATGATATMTVTTAGTGSFTTSGLATSGATTVTITSLASGASPSICSSAISTNNTAVITVNAVPAQPSSITGNTTPCSGTSLTYSVTNVAGVTYNWIFPAGWTQTGGGTTNSITVTVGSTSGNVQVTPQNACGTGVARTLAVATIQTPVQPSAITGNTAPCVGATSLSYAVTNVAGVTYNWTLPSGWTQTGGTNTNAITVTAGSASGNISVTATNSCGTSSASTLAVTASAAPAQPSTITGPTSACQGTLQSYSVTAVSGVSYTWTFPVGWTQSSGGTTNAITVTVGSGSGNITVTPTVGCGSGPVRTLAVTGNALPVILTTTPGSRTGSGPVVLGATASVGTISWFAAATGGTALGTGTTFTTPDIITSTTFYIEVSNGGCTTSPRTGVLATVNAPEIAVSGNGYNIADEDTTPETTDYTDLGTSNVLIPLTRTYTIQNIGSLSLTIGTFTISGANASEFVLVTSPAATLASGASTTFSIRFTPTAVGVRNAYVSFVTNDSDENPFNFNISGTGGTGVSPEINIRAGATPTDIPDGSALTQTSNYTDMGSVTIGSSITRTYTIQNTGTGPLTLTNSPNFVVLTGSGFFTVATQPSGTIAAGGSTTFSIKYTPTTTGSAVAIVTIGNTDTDESTYDFTITANATVSGRDIGIQGNEVLIEDGATTANITDQTDFGITDLTTPIAIPFNVYSFGSTSVTVASTGITAGQDFTITPLNNVTVVSGTPNSFVVTFTPTAIGVRTATVTITSNANSPSTKASYTFVVKAEVQNMAALTTAPGGVTSNLKFWLKADSEIGAVSDEATINIWNDQTTGSTKDGLAKFGKEPKFRNNTSSNVNFNPVIHFNGSNTMSGSQGFNHQDMFVVLKPTNAISYLTSAQDIYCGDDVTVNKNSQDVTGFQMGNTSARYNASGGNDLVAYNQAANTSYGVGELNSTKTYSGVNIFNPRKSSLNRMMLLCNGNTLSTIEVNTGTYKNIINSRYWLGRSEFYDASYDGDILEIINYSGLNSAADKSKIESYLAIKYGITLGVNGVSQDYVDSDGNTIFPASNGFNYNIAAIGRDDKSGLNQKQSKTENTSNDVTMGLTNIQPRNSDNTSTFDTDKDFLIWGSNNGTLGAQAPILVNMSSGISGLTTQVDFTSIGRTWKVIEYGGDVKTVTVSVPSTLLTSTITPPGDFLMFISSSPIFSPTAEYRIMRANGSKLETTYDFNGTTYITFGYAPERTFVRSVTFDGVDDYMDAGNVLNLDNTNFTVSAWVKRNTAGRTILSKRNSTFTAGYDLMINSGGYAEMSWINGTKQTITSSVIIPTDKWHNIAVTFDGTNAKMYIDGVLDVTAPLLPVLSSTQSFIIAGADGTATTSFFNGTIDEVRVWGTALSVAELRYVMNQELLEHSDSTVNGNILPQTITLNEVKDIPWTTVKAYYPMSTYTYTNAKDMSDNDYTAAIKNLSTVNYQTAPLPYVSAANGDWSSDATWKNSDVQDIPYSYSIVDGTTRIGWNIVQTTHNITSTSNEVVLGLDMQSGQITADNDIKIEVSHYLNLNGKIDLVGRSQLVQSFGSDLNPASSGTIERDQQGQTNLYNYNYWSSPVSAPSTVANNLGYTITEVFKDATDPDNIKNINWTASQDGAPTNPITVSSAWIFKFQNLSNAYANWGYIGSNGTLLPGEGFTMKGCGVAAATQNYAFTGKPNNGPVTLPIAAGNLNLCGNPYASSLDSQKFINDNLGSIDGTLYFWEHYSTNNTHVYAQYQGGYAALTNTGGTPPVSPVGISGLGSSTRIPKRFIPVGQGFFVVGNTTGGTIKFDNNQRLFVKESSTSSNVMFRNANQTNTANTPADNNGISNQDDSYNIQTTFSKIRLGYNSATNYHRQLLLGFMNENASSAIDPGYDAVMFDQLPDDMYFLNNGVKLLIQGEGFFNEANIYQLGVKAGIDGMVQFGIDEMNDFDPNQDVYIYDAEDQSYHDIKNNDFNIILAQGTYDDRFSLRFVNTTLGTDNQQTTGPLISFTNSNNTINIQDQTHKFEINSVTMYNVLGQSLQVWDTVDNNNGLLQIPISNYAAGTYIVKINTSTGNFSKKIVVK
ncbi:choice-of-anchor D domain-containing protein [Flavobacterium sp.]|uniref:choice-of-anchor D domain-containing protein n=1 Tax=Flavobacterium sp. TaxID=239 RepID=UPI002631C279|nr:choice-of-anchor D domain-containing protein [Flavobacterium sp.]